MPKLSATITEPFVGEKIYVNRLGLLCPEVEFNKDILDNNLFCMFTANRKN